MNAIPQQWLDSGYDASLLSYHIVGFEAIDRVVLKCDVEDVPAGTRVTLITQLYGGRVGSCLIHVQPHPTDKNCDWSEIAPLPVDYLSADMDKYANDVDWWRL